MHGSGSSGGAVGTITFVAKHAFQGNAAQSQLAFAAGATIVARRGQEGNAWWWGNYGGREGWFPPAYVTPLAATPLATGVGGNVASGQGQPAAAAVGQQISMQQRMQQASFASSTQVKQKQQLQQRATAFPGGNMDAPPNTVASYADPFAVRSGQPAQLQTTSGFGLQQQQQQRAQQTTQQASRAMPVAATGFGALSAAGIDPFAGLEATPSYLPAAGVASPATTTPPKPSDRKSVV